MQDYTLQQGNINNDFLNLITNVYKNERYGIKITSIDKTLIYIRKELLDWQLSKYTDKNYILGTLYSDDCDINCNQTMEYVKPIQIVNNYNTGTNNEEFIANETLTGITNNNNKIFLFAFTPILNKEMIFVNGLLQIRYIDYTISGNVLTMILAPFSTDVLTTSYFKSI